MNELGDHHKERKWQLNTGMKLQEACVMGII